MVTHRALEWFSKRIGILFRIINVQQRLVFRFRGRGGGSPRRRRVQRDRLATATRPIVLRVIAAHCCCTNREKKKYGVIHIHYTCQTSPDILLLQELYIVIA